MIDDSAFGGDPHLSSLICHLHLPSAIYHLQIFKSPNLQISPYLFPMNPKYWLIIFVFGLGQELAAQTFGGFPPSTKWKQINSDTVRIIFTPGAEEEANRISTLI